MIGSRRNGRAANPGDDIDGELAAIDIEIRQTETTGMPLADRLQQAESELERCAEHYRAHGFAPMGTLPQEREHYRHLATVGAMMTIGKVALLQAERERVTAAFQAAGGRGMSRDAKAEHLAELSARRRVLMARREIEFRAQEASSGEIAADAMRAGELFLLSDKDLTREAA